LIALIINAHSPRQVTARTPRRLRERLATIRLRKEARPVWALTERPACFEIDPRRRAVKRAYRMGVRRSSSLRTTTDRSPLHDVRQPASR
jgi:hypothetical protein